MDGRLDGWAMVVDDVMFGVVSYLILSLFVVEGGERGLVGMYQV